MSLKELFVKNFSYTFLSNLLSTMISIILVLVVPKFVGVEEYGLWQLYTFYSQYIAYCSFGVTDGAYLRYGGKEYDELPKKKLRGQYQFLVLVQVVVNIAIYFYVFAQEGNIKAPVLLAVGLVGLFTVPRSMLTFMLQATGRMKENAITVIIERVVYFIIVIVMLLSKKHSYLWMIAGDLIGKILSSLYAIKECRDLVVGKLCSIKTTLREVIINARLGIKLLVANLSGMLINGIIRIGIENKWGIEAFGRVSLTMNVSNFLMLFINSLGLVLFPILRRTDGKKLEDFYNMACSILMPVLFLLLPLCLPMEQILGAWLPAYRESLRYTIVLFPMLVFESKTSLLINTLLKTLRKENDLLLGNVSAVAFSFILTILSVNVFENEFLAILSITIVTAFKSLILESRLAKTLGKSYKLDMSIEVILAGLFILIAWNLSMWKALFVYYAIYIIYIWKNHKMIKSSLQIIRNM